MGVKIIFLNQFGISELREIFFQLFSKFWNKFPATSVVLEVDAMLFWWEDPEKVFCELRNFT